MTRFLIRILLCTLVATGLGAQQTEVVLSATSSAKLVLAMAPPQAFWPGPGHGCGGVHGGAEAGPG